MQSIADIMTKDVFTVKRETTVRELAEIFETRHFGSLPVVDDEGRLTGIVTASDLPYFITIRRSNIYRRVGKRKTSIRCS